MRVCVFLCCCSSKLLGGISTLYVLCLWGGMVLLLLQLSKRRGHAHRRVELRPKSSMCGSIVPSRRRCRHRRIHTTTVARTEECFVFFIQGGGGRDRLGVGVLVLVVALPTTGRSDDHFLIGTLILLDELLQHHRGILHLHRRRRRRLVGSDAQCRARGLATIIGALRLFPDRLVPFLLLLDQIGLDMRDILFHHPCETLATIATRRAAGGASTIGRKKQLIQPYCPFE